jgi:hypothetical protein
MSKESAQTALGKFAEAVNTGNFDLFDQVVAINCVDHDPADGQVPGPPVIACSFPECAPPCPT